MTRMTTLGLVGAIFLLVACSSSPEPTADEPPQPQEETAETSGEDDTAEFDDLQIYATGPVARIDGEDISAREYNESVDDFLATFPAIENPEILEGFKDDLLIQLIDDHLVDLSLDDADLEVSDEEIDEAIEQYRKGGQFTDEEFDQFLDDVEMTQEELREEFARQVAFEKLLGEHYDLEVSDEEVEEFFEEHRAHYAESPKAGARHILVEVNRDAGEEESKKAKERAQKLYEEATEGAEFAELAREHSSCPSAEDGGDLGMFGRDTMVPEFSKAVFDNLDVGEISEPVRTDFGYHIIVKTAYEPGGEPELDDVRAGIEETMAAGKQVEAWEELKPKLYDKYEVEELRQNIEIRPEAGSE